MSKKPTVLSLGDLVGLLATAKAAEDLAKSRRIKAEEAVAEVMPGPEIGQKTTTMADGTKVTVTRGYNYKADCEKISAFFRREQFDTPAPIKAKSTVMLDPAGYEWYRKNNPAAFAAMSQHVVVTPKKTSVTLKPAKVE